MKILLLNGPNMQLLGSREPELYGRTTLDEVVQRLRAVAAESGAELEAFQSNHEGDLVDAAGSARAQGFSGIVLNPAACGHTSIALRDALAASGLPAVEVHMTNVFARDEFRHTLLTAPVCIGLFCGFGADTYVWALRALLARLHDRTKTTGQPA